MASYCRLRIPGPARCLPRPIHIIAPGRLGDHIISACEGYMNKVSCKVLTTADASHWRALVPPTRFFFGSVEFARIAEQQTGHAAQLFVVEAGSARIAAPFFLRPIAGLEFAGAGERRFDALTPEFTGPILLSSDSSFGQDEFHTALDEILREQRIVAEFMHLHPWSGGNELLDPSLVRYNRDIVWVDLSIGVKGGVKGDQYGGAKGSQLLV